LINPITTLISRIIPLTYPPSHSILSFRSLLIFTAIHPFFSLHKVRLVHSFTPHLSFENQSNPKIRHHDSMPRVKMLSSIFITSMALASVVSAAQHAGRDPRRHHHRLAQRAGPGCKEGEWKCSGTQLQRELLHPPCPHTRIEADVLECVSSTWSTVRDCIGENMVCSCAPPPALFFLQADNPGRSLIIRVASGRGESLDASTSFADPKGRRYHFRPLFFRISSCNRYCRPKFICDGWRAGQYRRTRLVYASGG
jgi:hypothetical protein